MLQNLIAYHCGPALAGIKPANILTCKKSLIPDITEQVKRLNKELNRKDIYLVVLCEWETRALVMLYRKKRLAVRLNQEEIKHFLCSFGYPAGCAIEQYIECLKGRVAACHEFPHEIGAFLGYPLHDIHGFIHHKHKGCLFTGEWRVYKDEEQARVLFARYKACKETIFKRVSAGQTLAELFCTV